MIFYKGKTRKMQQGGVYGSKRYGYDPGRTAGLFKSSDKAVRDFAKDLTPTQTFSNMASTAYTPSHNMPKTAFKDFSKIDTSKLNTLQDTSAARAKLHNLEDLSGVTNGKPSMAGEIKGKNTFKYPDAAILDKPVVKAPQNVGGIKKTWDSLGDYGKAGVTAAASAAISMGTNAINRTEPGVYEDKNVAVDAAGGFLQGVLTNTSSWQAAAINGVIGGVTGLIKGKGEKKDQKVVKKRMARQATLVRLNAQEKALKEREENAVAGADMLYGESTNKGGYNS